MEQKQIQPQKNLKFDPEKRKKYCRIAIIGNVDSGKSTIVGVLSKGELDNGDGKAREKVFNYVHEKQNGRTSSIAQEIMGFSSDGKQMLPKHFSQDKNRYWKEVVEQSNKVVKLLDLAGHEKYLKTTMFGLSGLCPDYCMVIIGSNMGIKKMTKEHLGIAFALNIPLFIVLTKIDICPENIMTETQKQLRLILRKQLNRIPIDIKDNHKVEEIQQCADQLPGQGICPIFHVSSVTGQGLPELKKFLHLVDNRDSTNKLIKTVDDPFEFDIHEHFLVKGVGIVVSGLVKSGTVKVGQIVNLGPDRQKSFKQIVVRHIHIDRMSEDIAGPGELACLNIKPLKNHEKLNRSDFRKGIMITDSTVKTDLIWEFNCEVKILHHATTIKPNYESVVHCGIIRQTAKLVELYGKQELQNRDQGSVRMRFKYSPEIIRAGLSVLFREGRTKILGTITQVFTDEELKQEKELKQKLKENKENALQTEIGQTQKKNSEEEEKNNHNDTQKLQEIQNENKNLLLTNKNGEITRTEKNNSDNLKVKKKKSSEISNN